MRPETRDLRPETRGWVLVGQGGVLPRAGSPCPRAFLAPCRLRPGRTPSFFPAEAGKKKVVEPIGIEPTTSCRCSRGAWHARDR